jgi:hypothetical protein
MAEVHYRTRDGIILRGKSFDEFSELGTFIEHGVHWDAIEKIEIERLHNPRPNFTIEDADEA